MTFGTSLENGCNILEHSIDELSESILGILLKRGKKVRVGKNFEKNSLKKMILTLLIYDYDFFLFEILSFYLDFTTLLSTENPRTKIVDPCLREKDEYISRTPKTSIMKSASARIECNRLEVYECAFVCHTFMGKHLEWCQVIHVFERGEDE